MENGSLHEGDIVRKSSAAENVQLPSGNIIDSQSNPRQKTFTESSPETSLEQKLAINGASESKGSYCEIEQGLVGNLSDSQTLSDPPPSISTVLRGSTISEKEISDERDVERSNQSSSAEEAVEDNNVVNATRVETENDIGHAAEVVNAQSGNQGLLISKVGIGSEDPPEDASSASVPKENSTTSASPSNKNSKSSIIDGDPSDGVDGDLSREESDSDGFGDFGDFEGCSTVQTDRIVEDNEPQNIGASTSAEAGDDFGDFSEASVHIGEKTDSGQGNINDGSIPPVTEVPSDGDEEFMQAPGSSATNNSPQGKILPASGEGLGSLSGTAFASAVTELLFPLTAVKTSIPVEQSPGGSELRPLRDINIRLPDSSSLGLNLLHVKPLPPGFLRGKGLPMVLASRVSGFEQKLLSYLGLVDAYNQATVQDNARKHGSHEHEESGATSDAFRNAIDIDSPPSSMKLPTGSEGGQLQFEHDLNFLQQISVGGSSTQSVAKSDLSFSSGDQITSGILNPMAVNHTRDLSSIFDALADLAPSIPGAVDTLADPLDDLPMVSTQDTTSSKALNHVNSLELWGMGGHETLDDASARVTDPETSGEPHAQDLEGASKSFDLAPTSESTLGRASPKLGMGPGDLNPDLGYPNQSTPNASLQQVNAIDTEGSRAQAGTGVMESSSLQNLDGDVILFPASKEGRIDSGSEFPGSSAKAISANQYSQNFSILDSASPQITGVEQLEYSKDEPCRRNQGASSPDRSNELSHSHKDGRGSHDDVHPEPESLFTDDWLSNLKGSREPKSSPKNEADNVAWGEFSDAPQTETVPQQSLGLNAVPLQHSIEPPPNGTGFNPAITGYGFSGLGSKENTEFQSRNQASDSLFDGLSLSSQQMDLNSDSSPLQMLPGTSSQLKFTGSDAHMDDKVVLSNVHNESTKSFQDDLQGSNSKSVQEDQWGVFQDV